MELRFIESFSKFLNAFRAAFVPHFAVIALELPPGESRAASDAVTRLASRASTRRGVASPQVGRKIFGLKNPAQRRAKGHFQLATWNVRSLVNTSGPIETAFARGSRIPKDFDDRRIDLVVEELKCSGIEVAGLQ